MEVIVTLFLMILMVAMLGLWLSMLLGLLGYMVVAYVLESKALLAIAERRGLDRPWLAWIPGVKLCVLGAISDQYRNLAYGQERNRQKLLLWLGIVSLLVTTVVMTLLGIWAIVSIATIAVQEMELFAAVYFLGYGFIWLMALGSGALNTVTGVFKYLACYDLFRSCDPGKSLVYLLVSIFATYPLPFFLYSCREKDLGMPPRNNEPKGE